MRKFLVKRILTRLFISIQELDSEKGGALRREKGDLRGCHLRALIVYVECARGSRLRVSPFSNPRPDEWPRRRHEYPLRCKSNNELRHGLTNHLRDLPLIPSFLPPIRSSTLEKFEFLPESFLHSISFRIFLLRFSIDSFFSPLVEKDSAREGSYDKKILVSLGGIKKKKGI